MELAITADPLFEQVALVGEGRPFIACIVVLNRALWNALASSVGLDAAAPASLAAPAATGIVMDHIRRQTGQFPAPSQPRRVLLTLEPWTMENTLLTPTLKLKRLNLDARFAQQIADLYAPR
jgi:long-chain acyl-CoA synthetase